MLLENKDCVPFDSLKIHSWFFIAILSFLEFLALNHIIIIFLEK
jgi:hypothetical protein